jgi:hypothetical protein
LVLLCLGAWLGVPTAGADEPADKPAASESPQAEPAAEDPEALKKLILKRVAAAQKAEQAQDDDGEDGAAPAKKQMREGGGHDVQRHRPDGERKHQQPVSVTLTPNRQAPAQPGAKAAPAKKQADADKQSQRKPQRQPARRGGKGCDSKVRTQVDLTPPPSGQPQPKFAVKEAVKHLGEVWGSQPMAFAFEFTNEGEAPLNIRLKGG